MVAFGGVAQLGVIYALALIAVLVVGYAATATRQAQQARIYAERSDRILDAMTEIFAPANPYVASPGSTTVAEALRRASDRFQSDEVGDPNFQVRMLLRLVEMLVVAEQFDEMLALSQRAENIATTHALDPALRAQAQVQTVAALQALGRYDEVLARVEAVSADLPEADRQRLQYYVATIRSERGDYRGAIDLLEPLAPRLLVADAAIRSDMIAALAIAYGSLGDFERARVLLVEARDMLDPDEPAHLPALLRRRSEIGNALGRLLRFEEAVREYEDMLEFAHAQLGSAHPTTAKITTWASLWLMMDERFEDAFLVFERLPPDVLTDEPFQRANYLESKAYAALYSGRWEQAVQRMLEASELAQSTLGENAPQLSYFATRLGWLLFEFEEWDLAAAAATQGHALSRGRRLLNGVLLQLLAERGHALPGWPDPEFMAGLPEGCTRVHGEVLRAVLAGAALPDQDIPGNCLPDMRTRLHALGLPLGEATRSPRAQPMRSPLTERWRARRGQVAEVPLPILDEGTRERFAAVITGLSSIPRQETR
ncbi:MAG TPA: tetratricopeptide repeat protein, partial [Xanthomonadaceae bacterium]|nr:tetratricopeptide repeat protein [Xanthomonadaceae bacterium]